MNLSLSLHFYFPTGEIPYLVLTIVSPNSRVSSLELALGIDTKAVIIGVVPKQRWASRLRHSGRMCLWPRGVS